MALITVNITQAFNTGLTPQDEQSLTADWVALLDLGTLLDAHLDDHTRHRCTHRARVVGRTFARYGLDSRVLVLDRERADLKGNEKWFMITFRAFTHLAVDLEPNVALGTTLDDRANRHEANDEGLALLNLDHHLLPDVRTTKEEASGNDAGTCVKFGNVALSNITYLRSPYFSTKAWYSSKTYGE